MLVWRSYLRGRYTLLPGARRPDQIILVLSSHRSGSTLLIDYLKSMPKSRFYGELLHDGECRGPRSTAKRDVMPFLQSLFHTEPAPCMGFKIHLEQLEASDVTLPDLKSFSDKTRFILLYRQSLFRQYVSHKLALSTDIWEQRDSQAPSRAPIRVEPEALLSEALLSYCDRIRGQYRRAIEALRGENYWVLSYEALQSLGPVRFGSVLSRWAQVPPFYAKSPLRKQSDLDLAKEVSNLGEVASLFEHPRTRLDLTELETRTIPEFAQTWIGA
jgi:hypothetical protein